MMRPCFGFQRIHVMRCREGRVVNRKRVHQLYRLEGLQLRRRVRRRKHRCLHRGPVPQTMARHECLSMDFVHDQFFDGRRFRILTVIDQWSHEAVIVEPHSGYCDRLIAELLESWVSTHGASKSITVEHSTEFTSQALEDWAGHRGVKLDFIHPGKSTENGHIERFNSRLRDACLNVQQFLSLADAKHKLETWRQDYNHCRPHSSLGYLAPLEYVARHHENRPSNVMDFQR